MENAKLHLIGNAHLDPVWMWRWQEGFSEILATFRSALDRMKEFPEFKFTSACAVYYQWVEKMDPEMFREIQQRVKEGRWNITGGWFLQPDCNLPDGESFARHGLISQRYFKEKFGVIAKTGYNVDSFGHNASLPQILKKSGMDHYVFMRPMPDEKQLDAEVFQWESPDGSQVITHRIPQMYALGMWETLDVIKSHKAWVEEHQQSRMAFYGVGNHGGGPTMKMLEKIKEMDLPDTLLSTPDDYFASLDEKKLPVLKDELQHHARGCYSASSFVKNQNRKCENNLLTAEKFCLLAEKLTGLPYPREELEKAWKNVLFNQFHDILGGCSIADAYTDAAYSFGETMNITEKVIYIALQSIAMQIDTLQGEQLPVYKYHSTLWKQWEHEVLGTPIVVFNPHPWPITIPLRINAKAKMVKNDRGEEIPFQLVRGKQTNGSDDFFDTLILAETGALGYAVYRVFAEKATEKSFEKQVIAEKYSLENSLIRVEFSKKTGDILKFSDKETGKIIIGSECSAILLDEKEADTWAHAKKYLGTEAGIFDLPEFVLIEDGPLFATLRVITRCGNSTLRRDYSIAAGSKIITVKTQVNFQEKHKSLKFTFPTIADHITAKIPYGTISRPLGTGEECCQSWFSAGDLCVANDGKYAYDTVIGQVRMTVLRSCIVNDHWSTKPENSEYMEQGIHEFTYQLFPFQSPAQAERTAQQLNAPPRMITASFHKGKLPERMSSLFCDNDQIVITALKKAEDGQDTIIRFYDAQGTNGQATIQFFDQRIWVEYAHHEIKTSNFSGRCLNLIEWEEQ